MFCQTGSTSTSLKYPKKIVYERDTVVAFTPLQVKKIQLISIELDEVKELNDRLKSQISKDSLLITSLDNVVKSYDRERELSPMIITNDSLRVAEYKIQIESLEKNIKKSRNGNKIFGGVVLTGLGILVGILVAN